MAQQWSQGLVELTGEVVGTILGCIAWPTKFTYASWQPWQYLQDVLGCLEGSNLFSFSLQNNTPTNVCVRYWHLDFIRVNCDYLECYEKKGMGTLREEKCSAAQIIPPTHSLIPITSNEVDEKWRKNERESQLVSYDWTASQASHWLRWYDIDGTVRYLINSYQMTDHSNVVQTICC